MKLIHAAVAAASLVAVPVLGQDPTAQAGKDAQAAHKAMHEAMTEQAAMPAQPPMMPDHMTPQAGAMHEHMAIGKTDAQHAAHQQATTNSVKDANAMRADMANRAAVGAAMGGAMNATGQGMDGMNAAGMMRSQGMNPGGGMMPDGGMGPGHMGSMPVTTGGAPSGGMPASGPSGSGAMPTSPQGTGTVTPSTTQPAGGMHR